MPHNDYSFRNVYGQPGASTVPSPAVLRNLDQLASQSIDGDNGGTWAPSSPIIIGGSGVQLTNLASITGGVTTGPQAAARALVVQSDAPALFIAGSRSRTVVFPIRDFLSRLDERSIYNSTQLPYDEGAPGAIGAGVVTTYNLAFLPTATVTRIVCVLPAFRLGTGTFTPTLRFRVGNPSAPTAVATPAGLGGMPGFRLSRITATGTVSNGNDITIPTWAVTHAYNVGDLVIPTSPNGRQFRCSVAGTSGGSQPATFTSAATGATVAADGSVSWICEIGPAGANSHYITLPLKATNAAYYAAGQWQDVTLPGNMLGSAGFFNSVANAYVLDISDASQTSNTFHSLRVTTSVAAFVTQP